MSVELILLLLQVTRLSNTQRSALDSTVSIGRQGTLSTLSYVVMETENTKNEFRQINVCGKAVVKERLKNKLNVQLAGFLVFVWMKYLK